MQRIAGDGGIDRERRGGMGDDSVKRIYIESRLWKFLTSEFLENVKSRYHYGENDMPLLRSVAADMAGCMRWQESVYLVYGNESGAQKNPSVQEDERDDGKGYHTTATVIMTLGIGIDLLQERYQSTGRMLESYMVESIGGELLMLGYRELSGWVKERTGYNVTAQHFFGEDARYPLAQMPEALARAGQTKVSCNDGFCLTPRKSVVYQIELSKDGGGESCTEPCAVCSMRASCTVRSRDVQA